MLIIFRLGAPAVIMMMVMRQAVIFSQRSRSALKTLNTMVHLRGGEARARQEYRRVRLRADAAHVLAAAVPRQVPRPRASASPSSAPSSRRRRRSCLRHSRWRWCLLRAAVAVQENAVSRPFAVISSMDSRRPLLPPQPRSLPRGRLYDHVHSGLPASTVVAATCSGSRSDRCVVALGVHARLATRQRDVRAEAIARVALGVHARLAMNQRDVRAEAITRVALGAHARPAMRRRDVRAEAIT
jgi:hypothetical protein